MKSFTLIVAVISLFCAGCDSDITAPKAGPIITEWRRVDPFEHIGVARTMEVIIKQGDSDSILLEVSEGYRSYIRTEVVNRVLRVYVDDDVDLANLEANDVTIYVPTLKSLVVSGASVVRTSDTLRSAELEMTVSGASYMNLTLDVPVARIVSSGASTWDLSGTVDRLYANPVSGASIIRSYDLACSYADLALSGASIVETTVTDTLRVNATGASIVRYKGRPNIQSVLTGGSVIEDRN